MPQASASAASPLAEPQAWRLAIPLLGSALLELPRASRSRTAYSGRWWGRPWIIVVGADAQQLRSATDTPCARA